MEDGEEEMILDHQTQMIVYLYEGTDFFLLLCYMDLTCLTSMCIIVQHVSAFHAFLTPMFRPFLFFLRILDSLLAGTIVSKAHP